MDWCLPPRLAASLAPPPPRARARARGKPLVAGIIYDIAEVHWGCCPTLDPSVTDLQAACRIAAAAMASSTLEACTVAAAAAGKPLFQAAAGMAMDTATAIMIHPAEELSERALTTVFHHQRLHSAKLQPGAEKSARYAAFLGGAARPTGAG